jgi:upstream activation factor subunit UAF30
MPTKKAQPVEPATKAKKSVPAKKAAVPAKVVEPKKVEPVKSEDVVVDAVADETQDVTTLNEFTEFMTRLTSLRTSLSNLLQDFKSLQKKTERELKNAQKAGLKRKRKTGARAPSGFVKPTLISNELAAFLGKPQGSELARTEVTREINAYIRANKLQDPDNGRKINPDAKLTKLLSVQKGEELTYFNLQRYMSPHFQKNGQPLNQ